MHRRQFLSAAAGTFAAFQSDSIGPRPDPPRPLLPGRPADAVARDEDFWFNVRHAFTVDRNMINLNNGGVSPAPKIVMDTEIRYLEMENMNPDLLHVAHSRSRRGNRAAGVWRELSAATPKRSRSRATPARRSRSCSSASI